MRSQTLQVIQIFIECNITVVWPRCENPSIHVETLEITVGWLVSTYPSIHFFVSRSRLSDEYIFKHLLFCWFELFTSRSVVCCACVQAFAFLLVLDLSVVLCCVCVRVVCGGGVRACYCGGGCGCGCVCVRFFLSCTEKRFRVYVQNAPVCTFKTPVTCDMGVLKVHMGVSWTYTRERFESSRCLSLSLSLSLFSSLSSHVSLSSLSLSRVSLCSSLFLSLLTQ